MENFEEKLDRFKELGKEMLEIAAPSSNPDVYTDLENAIVEVLKNLRVSYGISEAIKA